MFVGKNALVSLGMVCECTTLIASDWVQVDQSKGQLRPLLLALSPGDQGDTGPQEVA